MIYEVGEIMSKFVKYICNKKNITVLREDCKKCEEYNPCAKNGKWCFVGALIEEHDQMLEECALPNSESADASVLQDMSTVTINLGDGIRVDVLRNDIIKQLERDFYESGGLIFGA